MLWHGLFSSVAVGWKWVCRLKLNSLGVSALALLYGCHAAASAQSVRMNEIQVVGSHNSYHAGLTPGVTALLNRSNPKASRSLEYSHPSLTTQFDNGVRQIELDVHADSKGGRYAHLSADASLAKAGIAADAPYDPQHAMTRPGFKVMHVTGIDQRSNCALFVDCLREVKAWSSAHPKHVPLFLLIEAKEEKPRLPGTPMPEPFTPAVFDALDGEIRSVFAPEEMVTPDDLRGDSATLPEAIHKHGWPTLDSARGKVVFLLDNRAFTPMYSQGHAALRGRALFTNSAPATAESAFIEENDGSQAEIDALVKDGYLVRTRPDEGTEQARTNDTGRRELALHSGAQLVSTDYPPGERSKWTEYVVQLPDGLVARCNPVNAPKGCDSKAIEP